jgi:hypothetical protein
MFDNTIPGSSGGERRNPSVRVALEERVRAEFAEMPGMCLTAAQARRLFGLRSDVSDRVLATLVQQRSIVCDGERYRFNEGRNSRQAPPPTAHPLVHRRAS